MLGRFHAVAAISTLALLTCGCGGGSNASAGSTGSGPFPPPPENGRATYYAADGSGNCMFDPSPNDLDVAAMDGPEYANSEVCGECVAIQGPKGNVTVRIVDQCPDCEAGHLDLSQEAFAKIADVSAGNVPITWSVVPCNVTGNVAYRFKEGSSQYWTAIQVRNHRLPITSLAWNNSGNWEDVPRQDYNYFVVDSGVGTAGPFDVRITAADGQTLLDTLPGVVAGQIDPGN